MITVEKIQTEIESLSRPDYKRLLNWIHEKDWEEWDQELEEDIVAGKLDFLLEEALTEKDTLKVL